MTSIPAMPAITLTDSRAAVTRRAVWLLVAVALNAAELAIPRLPFLPWLKPGFANVVTILWIIKFGFKDAALYTALRIWISGFYFGFSLFAFSLSLAGGLLSTAAMSALWMTLGKRGWVGTIGIAAVGALFHNAGQLGVVYFTMAGNMSLFAQVPFMLGASIVFGGIVGLLTPAMAKIIGFYDTELGTSGAELPVKSSKCKNTHVSKTDALVVIITFAVSIWLMFVNKITILAIAAGLFSLISLTLNITARHSGQTPLHLVYAFFYPLKFYLLFLFIAATHLFFTYGVRIGGIPFVTKDGLLAFAKQSLRLWCWLQTAHIFNRYHFQEIFIGALRGFFPDKRDTMEAGMIALKHFPEIVRVAKSGKKISAAALLFRPGVVLTEYVDNMRRRIEALVG